MAASDWAVEVQDATRAFGEHRALDAVNVRVARGEIHALLGPNGAGKTTLLRLLAGVMSPTSGSCRLLGEQAEGLEDGVAQRIVGLIPSGDRTFYMRISGTENLLFFARLHGMQRREALRRSAEVLELVGLTHAARRPVGQYSHGMLKRLAVARAILTEPPILLVDEATHDLDPEGAEAVRGLVRGLADAGTAVLWTTQRLEEIRGFADSVTLLARGQTKFSGTVAQLMARSLSRRYIVHVRNGGKPPTELAYTMGRALGPLGRIAQHHSADPDHYMLDLTADAVLGDALATLTAARCSVLACREARSEIEEAFLLLTSDTAVEQVPA